jgi:hypothetical protein
MQILTRLALGMWLGRFDNVHCANFHHYAAGGVVVKAIRWRSAALQLRGLGSHVISSAQALVHIVHGILRRLKKADMKHSGISPLRSHALVVHQCQQKAIGIPQHRELIAAFLQGLKIEYRAEERRKSRHVVGGEVGVIHRYHRDSPFIESSIA